MAPRTKQPQSLWKLLSTSVHTVLPTTKHTTLLAPAFASLCYIDLLLWIKVLCSLVTERRSTSATSLLLLLLDLLQHASLVFLGHRNLILSRWDGDLSLGLLPSRSSIPPPRTVHPRVETPGATPQHSMLSFLWCNSGLPWKHVTPAYMGGLPPDNAS